MTLRTPAGRYGTRRPPRAFYAVGGALLVALAVLIVVLGRHAASPTIRFGVRSFATADRSVAVTFEVHKPAGRSAECVLRARDRYGAEVGRRSVPVPADPAGGGVTVLTRTLATSARPVTGEVPSCRLTG